jgi:putative oxidoreductase
MKKILSNDYLLLIFRIVVGMIFIFASLEKITNPAKFAENILNYKLLPDIFINLLAITLPWIELTCGLLLLFGIRSRESSIIIFTMLMIFTIGVFIAVLRGLNIDCGCFGTLMAEKIGLQKIIENTVLLIFSFIIILSGAGRFSLKNIS